MRNIVISIILFFTVLSLVFLANTHLLKLCDTIIISCDRIEELIEDDKIDKAYEESLNLLFFLEKETYLSSIYINHAELDGLTNQLVATSLRIRCYDKSESLASLHIIKYSASMIKALQAPTLNNIL